MQNPSLSLTSVRHSFRKDGDDIRSPRIEQRYFPYNQHRIDTTVAEMLGLNPQDEAVKEMLAYYRLPFASEPNLNGRQKKIIEELENHRQADGE